MGSTNVNIGINDEKISSRVLRPPGGGHTDIFGAPDLPVRRDMGRNASSILEGTNTNPIVASPVKPSAPPQKSDQPKEVGAPARGRVPPGGFSSGLW